MMRTDDLILELAEDAQPIGPAGQRVALAFLAGGLIALLIMVAMFGPPLQALPRTGMVPFGLKTGFTLAVALIAAAACVASGRPGDRPTRRLVLLTIPLLVLGAIAAFELTHVPPGGARDLLFGSTYGTCIAAVAGTSLPVLVLAIWTFRSLAPTRLGLAGFLIGLSSGAAAAVAYALYCPEVTASFLLAAYVPAMLIPALIGALVGPRLLRW